VVVSWSASGNVTIRYVLPVLYVSRIELPVQADSVQCKLKSESQGGSTDLIQRRILAI